MTEWGAIRKEFEETAITMNALAEKHDVKYSTLRSRKNREHWQRSDATERNDASDVATDKPGGQKGNNNSKGNSGGKAPPNNKNAVTHGLFAKWLPEETQEIMETIQNRNEADMLWDSIMFQYTAILRSQKIMYVTDINDMSKENISSSWGEGGGSDSYMVQFAWNKQAIFMNAQSRALGTLSNLIKQFITLTDEEDERRLKLQRMNAQIDLAKSQTAKLKAESGESDAIDDQDDGFLNALEAAGEELWPEK